MNTEEIQQIQTAAPPKPDGPRPRKSGRGKVVVLLVVIAVIAALMVRHFRQATAPEAVQDVTMVAVAKAAREDMYEEVPIPAEFRPYVESELHAMVTGYVDKMNVDFGDKVKKGEVLATLEVPELQDELHNAQAKLQQAQADYDDAHLIYTRLGEVNRQHPNLVAQQDIDTARSKDSAAASSIAAAKAEVGKYQTLVEYTNIVAPFDGVVTQRSADPGALVQAGTSSDRSMALLRVSDNYRLRLDFPVSVEYVKDVHPGDLVEVRVDSLGGKTFTGKVTRFTDEVNDETRTMTTEMEVDNPDLEIVPGMYAVAQFKFEEHPNALAIPTQAVANPKEPVVNVVNANQEIEARPVKLGIEMPNSYEVTDGLRDGELVVIGGDVHPGQKVETKMIDPSPNP